MGDDAISNGAAEDKGAPKWVVTFGDLMSLLLCFFVLLLSFSEMDRQKYKVVAGSMADAFGVQRKERVFESPRGAKMVALAFDQDMAPKYDREEYIATQVMESLGEELKEALEGKLRGLEDQVEIEVEGNQTIIRLLGGATFDSGQARIRPRLIPILKEIGSRLKSTEGDIIIAGHTDNVPVRGGAVRIQPQTFNCARGRGSGIHDRPGGNPPPAHFHHGIREIPTGPQQCKP